MNMYTNTKKSKKFILILVLLILFNFCYPKHINAAQWVEDLKDHIVAAPAKIFWILEDYLYRFLNNLFTNPDYEASAVGDIKLTPDNIIKGKFLLFDANIFKEVNNDSNYYDYEKDGAIAEGKKTLREVIARWYYALRNLAIVALLSVLVYVGIRMTISTIAQDKAKYKVMFKDWLVALCLLVVMHYMMIGILNITSLICDALGGGANPNLLKTLTSDITGVLNDDDDSPLYEYDNPEGKKLTIGDAYAKIVVFAGIVIYSFIFAVKYLKREFTIIFLILLGPISCITYPIDKISDGKAQAFNKWFAEFLYQVIIQPFHLLLYIVLIGAAAQLAEANVIYTLVCFSIMTPAEKFIKEMFGFKDKLGSPLAAAAAGGAIGNLLGKGMDALMSKGKGSGGSGGKDGGADNNSTPNELPPRTVDRDGLVDGQGGERENNVSTSQNQRVEEQDIPTLGSGEEPGGGASVSAAYQNSDDPVRDAKLAALDEQLAEGEIDEDEYNARLSEQMDNSQGEKDSNRQIGNAVDDAVDDAGDNLGYDAGDNEKNDAGDNEKNDAGDNEKNDAGDNEKNDARNNAEDNGKEKPTWKDKALEKGKKTLAIHEQRMAKKYGTTSRGKRWLKRAGRGAKALAKAGLIGGLGAIATTGLLLTGQGDKALAVATGVGGYALNKGMKTIKGATGAIKDYHRGLKNDDKKEKQAFKAFEADPKEIDKAVLSYRENHDGQDPGHNELRQELMDRFTLSRYNLSDDDIDHLLPIYQEKNTSLLEEKAKEEKIDISKLQKQAGGVDNLDKTKYRELLQSAVGKENVSKAEKIAGSQAKQTAKLAKFYKPKDLQDPKVMQNAYNRMVEQLKSQTNCTDQIADKYARQYLTNAAKMQGVAKESVALPSTHTTIDVPVEQKVPNMSDSLDLVNSELSTTQLERMNNVTIRLQNAGFNEGEIKAIASSCEGESVTEILDKYEAKIEYLNDGNAQEEAKMAIEARNGGRNATTKQVETEMKERLIVKSTFDVKDEKDVSALRELETENLKGKSQVQVAREFAVQNKGQLKNEAYMQKEKKKLETKLRNGGSSSEKAQKDADNIVKLAAQYNNEI